MEESLSIINIDLNYEKKPIKMSLLREPFCVALKKSEKKKRRPNRLLIATGKPSFRTKESKLKLAKGENFFPLLLTYTKLHILTRLQSELAITEKLASREN